MNIKPMIALVFFMFCIHTFYGQSPLDLKYLTQRWIEARLDSNGSVIKAPTSRGGWASLDIHSDSVLTYAGSFDCGFGKQRLGKWWINSQDSVLVFHFHTREGYMNTPENTSITEHEFYEIQTCTQTALILKSVDHGGVICFLSSKTQNTE